MNENIKQLRKIALKLDVSGTAIPIEITKLYQGGFGFVVLQAYVPITQNRSPNTKSLCTVFRTTIDRTGTRRQFNDDIYNLLHVDTVKLQDGEYQVFECPLPKAFTDTAGELEIVVNYCEIDDDNVIVSRLATNIYRTHVDPGGASSGETIDPTGGELARLNDLDVKMEQLEDSVDALLQKPDVSEANLVGVADVEITEDGRLKFSYLKGATGATGPATSNALPKMDGIASPGVSVESARGDHVHPGDSSKTDNTAFNAHVGDAARHVTGAERNAWNAKQSATPNGTEPLVNANNKLSEVYIPDSVLGQLEWCGNLDASTGTLVTDLTGGRAWRKGDYVIVAVSGDKPPANAANGQSIPVVVGDWLVYTGVAYNPAEPSTTGWSEIDNTDAVQSVNGKTGAVALQASDVGALPLTGGTVTGLLKLDGDYPLYAYRYRSNNNAPAIALDKPGGSTFGIGAVGEENVIRYGAAEIEGAAWQNPSIDFGYKHYFDGELYEGAGSRKVVTYSDSPPFPSNSIDDWTVNSGVYAIDSSVVTSGTYPTVLTNISSGFSGIIQVYKTGLDVSQKIHALFPQSIRNRIFVRSKTGSNNSSSWAELFTESNPQTVSQLHIRPATGDIHTWLTPGEQGMWYMNASGQTNAPGGSSDWFHYIGMSHVNPLGTFKILAYTADNSENGMWMKTRITGTWSNWVRVYTDKNKPTPAEIGAATRDGDNRPTQMSPERSNESNIAYGFNYSPGQLHVNFRGAITPITRMVMNTGMGSDVKARVGVGAPIEADDAATKAYVDYVAAGGNVQQVYDLIIRTQDEFEAMVASPTWFDAVSVALVGNGGGLLFTKQTGMKIPSTVKQIHGFNRATISVTGFLQDADNPGAIWVASKCDIQDIEITCSALSANDIRVIYVNGNSTVNLTNCTIGGSCYGANYSIYATNSTINVTNCTMSGSSSSGGYNVIYTGANGVINLSDCIIGGGSGGIYRGFYADAGTINAIHCMINGNGSPYYGIYATGGTVNATNCTIRGSGGISNYCALYVASSSVSLLRCNQVTVLPPSAGGAIQLSLGAASKYIITNCIFPNRTMTGIPPTDKIPAADDTTATQIWHSNLYTG